MKVRVFGPLALALLILVLTVSGSLLSAQDIAGGVSLIRDLAGGAALIFRAPKDPVVHLANYVAGPLGGTIKGKKQPKPPVRKQDQAIERANAARSAPKPRYEEAEEQYRLAASIAPDDARAFAGLGNVYVDQGRFKDATDSYQ